MKRTQRNVFLAGLLLLTLSACSSWGGWKNFGGFGSGGTSSNGVSTNGSTDGASGTGVSTEKPTSNGAATNDQRP